MPSTSARPSAGRPRRAIALLAAWALTGAVEAPLLGASADRAPVSATARGATAPARASVAAAVDRPTGAARATAADTAITLRYRRIAAGEAVISQVNQRTHDRLRDLAGDSTPSFHEQVYVAARAAQYERVGPDEVAFTLLVLADETRRGMFGEPEEHSPAASYSVVVRGDSVRVTPEDEDAAPEVLERIRGQMSARPVNDVLGELVEGTRWSTGERRPLPPPMLALLGADSGTIALAAVETRWAHEVARFRLDAMAPRPYGHVLHLRGELLVDVESGRPLQLGFVGDGSNGAGVEVGDAWVERVGTEQFLRTWSYSGVRLEGLDVGMVPQVAPNAAVDALAVSPDGATLAILTAEGQLALWDTRLRRVTRVLKGGGAALGFLGDQLLLQDRFGFDRTWLLTGEPQPFGSFRPTADLEREAVGWGAAGMYPVTAYSTGEVVVSNPGYGRPAGSFTVAGGGLQSAATSPEGELLATLSTAGELALHELRIGTGGCGGDWRTSWCEVARLAPAGVVARAATGVTDARALTVAPDGETVAITDAAGRLHLWTRGSDALRTIAGAGLTAVFSADGGHVLTERGRFDARGSAPPLRFDGAPAGSEGVRLAAAPEGDLLFRSRIAPSAGGGGERGGLPVIDIVDLATGTVIDSIHSRTSPLADALLMDSEDGPLAVVEAGGRVGIWDLALPAVQQRNLGFRTRVHGGFGSPRLALHADQGVLVVEADTGFVVDGAATAAALSADGERMARADWRGVITVGATAPAGPQVELEPDGSASAPLTLRFDPRSAGRLLALSGDGTLRLWDVDAGAPVFTRGLEIRLPYSPTEAATVAVAISPDGGRIAVARGRDTTGIWNPQIPQVLLLDGATGLLAGHLDPRWGEATALDFSPDGTLLAVGTGEGGIRLYHVASGTITARFDAHEGEVTRVLFLPDGDRYLSAGRDGALKLWRAHDPGPMRQPDLAIARPILKERPTHLVATLVAVDSAQHVVATPDGYYTATHGALRGIAFTEGGEAFDFERFDPWLNRPDIVLERLAFADEDRRALFRTAVARRTERLGGTLPSLTSARDSAPELEVRDGWPRLTSAGEVALDLAAAARAPTPLERLHVRVNSVPLDGIEGRRVAGGAEWAERVTVPLSHGVNRIQLSVTDAAGVESSRRTVVVHRTGEPPPPSLYVVTVGVSDYREDRLDLRYAAKDAGDIAELLGSREAYAAVHVLPILDGDATRDGILAARAFLERAGVDDHVVVFFAGHGFLADGRDYFFGTTDIDPTDPRARGLSYEALMGLMDGIAARKRLLLLDTCHAGEVDDEAPPPASTVAVGDSVRLEVREMRGFGAPAAPGETRVNSFEAMRELFADLRAQSGTIVLSASGGAEYALESPQWENGAFTYSIKEAFERLTGGAAIPVSELQAYVETRVVELTAGGQQPTARQRNLDVDFALR